MSFIDLFIENNGSFFQKDAGTLLGTDGIYFGTDGILWGTDGILWGTNGTFWGACRYNPRIELWFPVIDLDSWLNVDSF